MPPPEVNKDFPANGFFNWTESLRLEYQATLTIRSKAKNLGKTYEEEEYSRQGIIRVIRNKP